MLIGLFENSNTALYELMNSLSIELGFDVMLLKNVEDVTFETMDGLVVTDEFSSSASIAGILKQFKNILLLDPSKASAVVDQELLIICEEAGVELMVGGPAVDPYVFQFIGQHAADPFYVRISQEECGLVPISFDVLYQSLYWNAFFSDGDIRRVKANALPSVSKKGLIFYGKTESAKNIPIDTWFSNLGFDRSHSVKIFSQSSVAELDLVRWRFRAKNANGAIHENGSEQLSQAPFVRSFVDRLMGNDARQLNVSIYNFLKVREAYDMAVKKMSL